MHGWSLAALSALAPVIGGTPAPAGKYPDIVAMPFDGGRDSVYCTGVLVAPTVVLTAGHCVIDPPPPGNVLVGTASLARPEDGELIDIAAIHEFPGSQTSADLAVLVLATPSTRTPRPIATGWAAADIANGATVEIAGWGALDRDAFEFADELHEAATTITDADCSTSSGCNDAARPTGELGAGGMGVDTCPGDSGGPLYLVTAYGTFVAGITSRGYDDATFECSEGGIYGRPDAAIAWIEQVAGVSVGRGPEPSAPPIEADALGGRTTIAHNDPKPTGHHFSIVTQPANAAAAVRGDGQLMVCPTMAGDGVVTVAIADAANAKRRVTLDIPVRATAVATSCDLEAFVDAGGCCSASSGGSSAILAALAALALRRRRKLVPCPTSG